MKIAKESRIVLNKCVCVCVCRL